MAHLNHFADHRKRTAGLVCLLGWLVFGGLVAGSIWAQEGGARIKGLVKGKGGEQVGDAWITLVDLRTKRNVREFPANGDGSYAREGIPPGEYSVWVQDGRTYKPACQKSKLIDREETELNFFLDIARKVIALGGTARGPKGEALGLV